MEIPTKEKIEEVFTVISSSEDDILNELGNVEKVKSIEFKSGRVTKFLDSVSLGLSSDS